MSYPTSSATEEKTSAGKFNTETVIPEKFELTDEFKNTYNLINKTNKNLFITGKAGCGKSTLLEYFRQNTNKNSLKTFWSNLGPIVVQVWSHLWYNFGTMLAQVWFHCWFNVGQILIKFWYTLAMRLVVFGWLWSKFANCFGMFWVVFGLCLQCFTMFLQCFYNVLHCLYTVFYFVFTLFLHCCALLL